MAAPALVMTYVALLRGINVGGHKKVPMAALKKALERAGYENVRTLLASGNVVLDAKARDAASLRRALEPLLEKTFGFEIPVIVRPAAEIAALLAQQPFKGIPVTTDTRLYVTFLGDGSAPKGTIAIPYSAHGGHFRILRASKTEVLSAAILSPDVDTVKAMAVLEKEFGRDVTTRNWNTVVKLLAGVPGQSR